RHGDPGRNARGGDAGQGTRSARGHAGRALGPHESEGLSGPRPATQGRRRAGGMNAPHHHHAERHFTGAEVVRDVVLGMSDGLTVPFALAAGLTGAVAQTRILVVAGVAEIAAGAIAMGLGGYLAAKSQIEHYASERARERREITEKPAAEEAEVLDVLE